MSIVCQICGKKKATGSSQKHHRGVAGKRWLKRAPKTKRVFYPNLQMKTFVINGEDKKMKVCAKCIKAVKNFKKVGEYKNITVV